MNLKKIFFVFFVTTTGAFYFANARGSQSPSMVETPKAAETLPLNDSADFPDAELLKQIVTAGLAAEHERAFSLAADYTKKHSNHPCGYFTLGLVHEWLIEPQEPEPPLQPAIDAFEKARTFRETNWTPGAGLCRGAAQVRLSRIYYKYGQYLLSVKRAIGGGKDLEEVHKTAPELYDLYTFLGPYHYFTENAPAPVRIFMRLFGLKGDKAKGLRELNLAYEKAPIFRDEAGQVLFVLQTKYEGHYGKFDEIPRDLVKRYPKNVIFQRLLAQTNLHP